VLLYAQRTRKSDGNHRLRCPPAGQHDDVRPIRGTIKIAPTALRLADGSPNTQTVSTEVVGEKGRKDTEEFGDVV
jgi:hypothetical protein